MNWYNCNNGVSFSSSTKMVDGGRVDTKGDRHIECESPISSDKFPHHYVAHEDDEGYEYSYQAVLPSVPQLSHDKRNMSSSILCLEESFESTKEVDDTKENVLVVKKPFFIMDFLEEVNPHDLELARSLLNCRHDCKNSKEPVGSRLPSTVKHSNGQFMVESKSPNEVAGMHGNGQVRTSYPHLTQSPSALATAPSITEASNATLSTSVFFHRSVAIGNKYNAKGISCATSGNWKKALSYWEDTLEIRTQILGESLDVANTCNNIGIALGKLNRYSEAITSMQRALDIRIAHCTWDHSIVAATFHNMGNIYQQSMNLVAAIQCFHESEAILEKLYGRDHPEVARSLVAMGDTYKLGNAIVDARQAYLDALSIFEQLGAAFHHPEVQTIIRDIQGLDELLYFQNQE